MTNTQPTQENLFDKRDRLIREGKIKICGHQCKQEPIDGKLCYFHQKKNEGLFGMEAFLGR